MEFSWYEKDMLQQFRDRLTDVRIRDEYHTKDFTLIRFLRARNMDLGKAEEMYRKFVAWRLQNDMDNALKWNLAVDIRDRFKYHITGYTLDGGLICEATAGDFDPRLVDGRYEEFMQHGLQEVEHITAFYGHLAMKAGRFPKAVLLCNFQGLTFAHVTTVDFLRAVETLLKLYEANFPETLQVAFVLNAPWIFSILWSIVKPFISTATHRRIKFLSGDRTNWKAEITRYAAEDQFPKKYGGTLPDDQELLFRDGKVRVKSSGTLLNDDNENNKESLPITELTANSLVTTVI